MRLEQAIYELEYMKTWSKDLSDDEIEALKVALHVMNEKLNEIDKVEVLGKVSKINKHRLSEHLAEFEEGVRLRITECEDDLLEKLLFMREMNTITLIKHVVDVFPEVE